MKGLLIRGFCLAAGICILSASALCVETAEHFSIHVSPEGDDENAGTEDAPLQTLQAAQAAARALLAEDLERSITVRLSDGVYRIEEPLEFGPEDSPAEGHTVVWAAGPEGHPVISGGRVIDGWDENEDGTFSAVIDAVRDGDWRFRELFIDGERRHRARFPGEGFSRIDEAGEDQRTNFTFHDGDIPEELSGDVSDTGLELVFFHDWSITRTGVSEINHEENRLYVTHPVGQSANHYRIGHFEPHPRYYIENHRVLLDTPGEWHLDETTGELTYWPKDGETIDGIEAVAPVSQGLMHVRGASNEPVRGLNFRGLHFAHSAWGLPPRGYAGGQATIHEDRYEDDHSGRVLMPAAITFDFAEQCALLGGSVRNVGQTAVWFRRESHSNWMDGVLIDEVGGNGVNIGETRTRQVDGVSWTEAAPEQVSRGNRLSNCVIQRTGRICFSGVGVWVGMAADTEVRQNLIRDLPYTGVSVGWMWNPEPTPCARTIVDANHIHDVMQVLSDGGGIYTLGRQPGAILRGNLIHDVPLNVGRAESNGMFLDQGTKGLIIEGNLIHRVDRSPLRFHQAIGNVVRDNVLVLPDADTPKVRYNRTPEENIALVDNEVVNASDFAPATAVQFRYGVGPRVVPDDVPNSSGAFDPWAVESGDSE